MNWISSEPSPPSFSAAAAAIEQSNDDSLNGDLYRKYMWKWLIQNGNSSKMMGEKGGTKWKKFHTIVVLIHTHIKKKTNKQHRHKFCKRC